MKDGSSTYTHIITKISGAGRKLLGTALVLAMATGNAFSKPVNEAGERPDAKNHTHQAANDESLAQIAILLDVSGSMDGLVNQARCQVWNAVSELSRASRAGKASKLEIAVFEYGGVGSEDTGYGRQVIGFTEDLDEVSRALFSLVTGDGPGKEYCGQAVYDAITELAWSPASEVYKAIFIAGNEPFDQGSVSIERALVEDRDDTIVLNSIYCYDPKYTKVFKPTDTQQWAAAAKHGGGMYFKIEHNHHLPEMKTPYDKKMRELNERMNETFVWYGDHAHTASENQVKQDHNASEQSDHAFAARMSAKIGHLYHHVHHDLIDAISHGVVQLDKMPVQKMPPLLKEMPAGKRESFIEEKTMERNRVRREMAEVISQRHAFLERKMTKELGAKGHAPKVLGDALVEAVRLQSIERGFTFKMTRIDSVSKMGPIAKNP